MDKRSFAAVLISLAIWMGWHKVYFEPHQKAQREWLEYQQTLEAEKQAAAKQSDSASAKLVENAPAGKSAVTTGKISAKTDSPLAETGIELPNAKLVMSNGPALFRDWQVTDYKTSNENEDERRKIDLLWVSGFKDQLSLGFTGAPDGGLNGNFTVQAKKSAQELYRDSYQDSRVSLERSVLPGQTENTLQVNYSLKFKGEVPPYVFVNMYGNPRRENDTPGSIFGEYPDKVELTYFDRQGRHSQIADQLKEMTEVPSNVYWLGINTRYFLFAAVPANTEGLESTGVQLATLQHDGMAAVAGRLVFATAGKQSLEIPLKVYFGPKKLEALEAVGHALPNAIDFGSLSFIAIPLLKMLKAVYAVVGNYGIAIILVTIFVKILLFPLTYKSMKSMAKLSVLKPEMERIQKKYADDKQKQQQEIWALYKAHGANPLSGCLPILLQMPVFFALYRVLFNCMELYQAPFFFWIHDLSARDHYFITPVVLIGLMYLQQVTTPTTNVDPSQQAAMKLMPVIFGVFMIFLPSGLNIYMIVNTLFTLVQQYFLNRKFGIGKFAPGALASASAKST